MPEAEEKAHGLYEIRIRIPAGPNGVDNIARFAELICALENERGVPGHPITWALGYADGPWK